MNPNPAVKEVPMEYLARTKPTVAAPGVRGTTAMSTHAATLGRRRMGWMALLLLPLCLCGCGIPGFSKPSQLDDAGNPSSAGGRGSPQIAAITPQLIRTMAATQPTGLPPDVKQLFTTSPAYTIGPGDVIGIFVYRHPELLPNAGAVISQQSDPTGVTVAPGFIVDSLGEISFPSSDARASGG
jgi:polysaccharide export outer membrane protein